MRTVLFIVPTLRGGGAERVIVTLLRHLDPARFRMVLAVVDARAAVYRADVPASVEFVDLGCTRMRNAPWKILRLVWRVEPDVVFSTLAHLNLTLAALRSFMPGKSVFIGREGTIVTQMLSTFKHTGLWRAAYRALYPRFDAVVCQSRYMQKDLVENYGLAPEKTVVINNPVDLERVTRDLPPRKRRVDVRARLRLVAAGRFGPEKGFDLLLEAVALLRDLEISLCILGDGPLVPEIRRQISRLALDGSVTLPGFQADPFRYFAEADAFVLSSRFEGFPNVVLEALACGIGVIATPPSVERWRFSKAFRAACWRARSRRPRSRPRFVTGQRDRSMGSLRRSSTDTAPARSLISTPRSSIGCATSAKP